MIELNTIGNKEIFAFNLGPSDQALVMRNIK